MLANKRSPSLYIEDLTGFLIAMYLLVGRWNLSRIGNLVFVEPRIVISLLFIVLLFLPRRQRFVLPPDDTSRAFSPTQAILLAVFLGYMIITSFWSPNSELGFRKAIEVGIMLIVSLGLLRRLAVSNAQRILTSFWITLVISTSVIAILALLKVVQGEAPARLSILGGGPNTFGRMMGLLALALFDFGGRTSRPVPFIGFVIIPIILLILSGSRGAFVAFIVALIVFIVIEDIKFPKVGRLVMVFALIALLIFRLTPIGRQASSVFYTRIYNLLIVQQYTAGREQIFHKAYDLGLTHLLFGGGLNAYRSYELGNYPHNLFLETFSEGGSVGVMLLSILLLKFGIIILRAPRTFYGLGVGALTLIFLSSQFSGDLYDSRGVFVLLLLALIPRPTQARGFTYKSANLLQPTPMRGAIR